MSPIAHYELYGQARDLNPGPYLDAAWYRSTHAHMDAGNMSPLEHFLQAGMFEGLEPSPSRPEAIDWPVLSPVVVPLAADPNDRNVAIIASHDRRRIYGTAVEHLVAGFKDAGWLVVLALDHPVDAAVYTTADASRRPDAVLACDHQGYDFLSWRMAWEVLPDLRSARGVMLFNDSVLGPLAPLDHLTGALEAHTADVIGLVESGVPAPHIQSWGVYAKGRALAENGLGRHLERAAPSTPKSVIIARLEIGSAQFFRDKGCAVASVVSPTSMEFPDHNPSVIDAWSVLNAGVPFVKREALTLLDEGRLAAQHDPRAHLNDQQQERLAELSSDSVAQVASTIDRTTNPIR
jgi:lipopolysaccharide biosynthesis protein